MSLSTSIHDLKTLILSFHPAIAIETVEENRARSVLIAAAKNLDLGFFEWSLTRGLVMPPSSQAIHGTTDPFKLLRHMEGLTVEGVFLLKDFARHLEDATVARQFREVANRFARTRSTIVITGQNVDLPSEVEHEVVYYELKLPGREELHAALEAVLQSVRATNRVRVALEPEELDRLLNAMSGMTINQARQAIAHAIIEDGTLQPEDIERILDRKAHAIREGGLLEYFPAKDNQYELGGFKNLKSWLARARIGFTPEAKELNLTPPRGILLVGVQGCGKSLAAKAIAREWNLPLMKLDAGSLYDKFIGESEKNFRKAVAMAESMAPVVLWIDEIEKGMTPPGGNGSDGGLSKRLFGAFLTWLQEKRQEVFVVATANDLFALPPELMRKGRFDEIFFVDLPDENERETILGIHLKLRKQDPKDFEMPLLIAATDGFSGAEIEQAVISSLYRALHAKRPLDTEILLQEIKETIPLSVSRIEDINRLRATAKDRFVPVN